MEQPRTYRLKKDLPDAKAGSAITYDKFANEYWVQTKKGSRMYFQEGTIEDPNNSDWWEQVQPDSATPEVKLLCFDCKDVTEKGVWRYNFWTNQQMNGKIFRRVKSAITDAINETGTYEKPVIDPYTAVSFLESNGWVCMKGKEYYKQKDWIIQQAFDASRVASRKTTIAGCEFIGNFLYTTAADYLSSLQHTELKSIKPPLGLMPEWRHKELRLQEIEKAVSRYTEANEPVPLNWITETFCLKEWLKNREEENLTKPDTTSQSPIQDKPVLLTTEDGVGIREGEFFYEIDWSKWEAIKTQFIHFSPPFFSTKESAQEYITLNKPCLSAKEIFSLTAKYGLDAVKLEEEIEQLAKSKSTNNI